MYKTSVLFVIFMITLLNVFAQKPETSQITITGVIIDSNTEEPLEYATVILNNQETKQRENENISKNGTLKQKTKNQESPKNNKDK